MLVGILGHRYRVSFIGLLVLPLVFAIELGIRTGSMVDSKAARLSPLGLAEPTRPSTNRGIVEEPRTGSAVVLLLVEGWDVLPVTRIRPIMTLPPFGRRFGLGRIGITIDGLRSRYRVILVRAAPPRHAHHPQERCPLLHGKLL